MNNAEDQEVPVAEAQADPHVFSPAELEILQYCALAPLHQLA